MAHCKLTPQEFIKNSFTPQVAVICSPKADEISKKNNLTFRELLQPFCKLGTEAHFKDPTGHVVSIRNFKVALQDINFRPPQPVLARKLLNSSVSDAPVARFQTFDVEDYSLQTPMSVPWFSAWRDTFLQVQFPSDHEFTKHFIACMLVVSTTDENPIRMMVDLSQKVNDLQTSPKLPKWFSHNVLRYYIIIHEKHDTNNVHAVECYDNLKMQYGGNNVFLLRTNSRKHSQPDEMLPDPWSQYLTTRIQVAEYPTPDASPTSSRVFDDSLSNVDSTSNGDSLTYHPLSPEQEKPMIVSEEADDVTYTKPKAVVHGAFLSMEDIEQLKLLIHEFCTRALLPFVERQVTNLNEYVMNKKGVSRSFISATKRWFTPNKPGSSPSTAASPTYFPDAPELQVRRLGDLYFMFGHYSMAFQAYHTAKRDFNTDQAWLYYAGALEMAALSAFMANESSKKTMDYMEESITTYLNTCKLAQFATRATLLSSECLKGKQMYGEAAHQLIRMTSEESDLRSALLLEQAAYCFLHSTRPCMVRKYAFHMVLAGHRFSKAAQRKHSLRCYKQAFQVYENKGWNLAQDHIQYTIGRQASNLNLLEESVSSYSKLLTDQSQQSQQQQALFLKEYLTVHTILSKKNDSMLTQILPLPLMDNARLKVLVGPTQPLRTPGKVPALGISLLHKENSVQSSRWAKLEEMLVQEAQGSLPMIFKPLVSLFTEKNCHSAQPTAIMGEQVQVALQLKNPLQILLLMKDVYLLWEYTGIEIYITNDEPGDLSDRYIKTHYLQNVVLQANTTQEITLTLTPLAVGDLTLKGICYSLVSSNSPEDQIEVRGKQLFILSEARVKTEANSDKRFNIKVVPSSSCLQVCFGEISAEMLKNELQQVPIELRNVGGVPLHKVYLATSTPELVSCCEFSSDKYNFDSIVDIDSPALREREARKNHVFHFPLHNGQLEPGQSLQCNLWIRAAESPGFIDLLIYYENIDPTSTPRYRLVRHMWNFQIHDSIKVDITPYQSHTTKTVEQMSLSIKAVNMNRIHYPVSSTVTMLNATMHSDQWTLVNEIFNTDVVELGPQDYAHIILKARRRTTPGVDTTNLCSIVALSRKKPTQYSEKAYLDFAKRVDQFRINIFEDAENYQKPERKGTISLRWQAKITDSRGVERLVFGQNQVPINLTKPEEPEEIGYRGPIVFEEGRTDNNLAITKNQEQEDLLEKQQQIRCNVVHPPKLTHNFKLKKMCMIRIKLLLHSMSESNLEVIIKTLETPNPLPFNGVRPLRFSPHSSKHCRWIQIGSTLRTLPALRTDIVELTLAVLGPGTFDLGSYLEIWCQKVNQPETATLQTCRIQSSVIVAS